MADTLKVTLVKSPIGAVPKHRKTVEAMGLTKMHKTVEMPDNAATRGMIQQVQHLVSSLLIKCRRAPMFFNWLLFILVKVCW